MIYCDHNAGSPVRESVKRASAAALEIGGNPSSVHGPGRKARAAVERARRQVAALVGVEARQVVFTSGGTEANNLALCGCRGLPILASAIEHPSISTSSSNVETIPVTAAGVIDPAAVDRRLSETPAPTLVSVMLANNETGVIQPLSDIVRIARAHGALVHTDAIQAAGRIAVDFTALDVDLMSLSAHKIGGLPGVGALIVRADLDLAPLMLGGAQESGRRAGTENLPGIVGFGVAAECALSDLSESRRLARWRDRLESDIKAFAPEVPIYGEGEARLPNTSCIGMPGVGSETQVMAFDLDGVAVSAGSACSSGKVTRSHVLDAMGVGGGAAGEAIRISFGHSNGEADIEPIVAAWRRLYRRTRADATYRTPAARAAA